MVDVHKQWLAEFDHEQARRRGVQRRRRRQITAWAALMERLRTRRQERQPALSRLPQASQCL